jgi:hypothetical protein
VGKTTEAFPSVEQLREWGTNEETQSYRRAGREAEKKPEISMEERLRREREKQDEYAKAYSDYYREYQSSKPEVPSGMPEGFFFQPGDKRRLRAANTPKVGYENDMNTWEGKTVYALKKEIIKELETEVLREGSTEAERRTIFKQLAIRWHPDKNPDNRDVAKRVFQFIQSIKEWFLTGLTAN